MQIAAIATAAALSFGLTSFPSAAVAQTDSTDYVAELNEPILRLTARSKSYEAYFQAWSKLDLDDLRVPDSIEQLAFGSPNLSQAMSWVGEPSQQEAVDILLASDARNPNVTFREVFGLPYGTRDIPMAMESAGFAVFVNDGRLDDVEFTYLDPYLQIWRTLIAEAHRRAQDDNPNGAGQALLAATRMSRQLCDRSYRREMKTGMDTLLASIMQIREFMWHYRDRMDVENYSNLATELSLLQLDRIKPPAAHVLVGEQILAVVFDEEDFQPNADVFAQTLARFETRYRPLLRFSAAAKWRDLMSQHASYNLTAAELEAVGGDMRLRWRFSYNDPTYDRKPYVDGLDPVRYAIPRAVFYGIDELRAIKHDLIVRQHGIATSSGIIAYMLREGVEEMEIDEPLRRVAPVKLAQVQPTFVPEQVLTDPQNPGFDPQNPESDKLHYVVITNREEVRTVRVKTFTIRTENGNLEVPEGWPLLYSVGWDEDDDLGAIHTEKREEFGGPPNGDFVFWPPVEVIARYQ